MGWIRIRMDPKLLPGSGSGTLKIQSWIWNKSFRIHNTGLVARFLSFISSGPLRWVPQCPRSGACIEA